MDVFWPQHTSTLAQTMYWERCRKVGVSLEAVRISLRVSCMKTEVQSFCDILYAMIESIPVIGEHM